MDTNGIHTEPKASCNDPFIPADMPKARVLAFGMSAGLLARFE